MAARLCGVNVRHVYALTFAVSAAFAGAAGIDHRHHPAVLAGRRGELDAERLRRRVLGGVGSPAGALLGGLLLGDCEHADGAVIGPAFPNVTMFLLLVLLLLVRPTGLLGNAFAASTMDSRS